VPEFAASYLGPYGPGFAQYFGQPGLVIAGGGDNLKPQTATNYAFGVDATPHLWSGLHISADYYHIHFKNFVAIPYPGNFTDPTLSQYGILAPVVNGVVVPFTPNSPEVTRFTSHLPVDGVVLPSQIYYISILERVNVSQKRQDGIDFNISQQVPIAGGTVTAAFAGNYILHDEQAATAAAPFVATSDKHLFLHNISLEFQKKGFRIGGIRSHLSAPSAVAGVPGVTFDIINLYASYKLPDSGFLSGFELSINVDNVGDARPPFNAYLPGGGDNTYPLGRVFTLGIRKHW
jgi:iron complex outermembrane receptor protein